MNLTSKELLPSVVERLNALNAEDLVVVNRVLMQLEINRTVAELNAASDELRSKGMLERLPEIIEEVRAEKRLGR
jgi:hypothetical protein